MNVKHLLALKEMSRLEESCMNEIHKKKNVRANAELILRINKIKEKYYTPYSTTCCKV